MINLHRDDDPINMKFEYFISAPPSPISFPCSRFHDVNPQIPEIKSIPIFFLLLFLRRNWKFCIQIYVWNEEDAFASCRCLIRVDYCEHTKNELSKYHEVPRKKSNRTSHFASTHLDSRISSRLLRFPEI